MRVAALNHRPVVTRCEVPAAAILAPDAKVQPGYEPGALGSGADVAQGSLWATLRPAT